ncbi:MAG TPA: hypothetical protein PLP88_04515, partial [Bacteroidales bacterium]|nr:hypothetical protein [Bacteroidales bacterium]
MCRAIVKDRKINIFVYREREGKRVPGAAFLVPEKECRVPGATNHEIILLQPLTFPKAFGTI